MWAAESGNRAPGSLDPVPVRRRLGDGRKRSALVVHLKGMDAAMDEARADSIALLDAVVRRDESAFVRLVEMFDRDLIRLAYVMSGSRQTAEDAAQATWERLWTAPPALRDRTKLRSWLFTVAANQARQTGRRQRRLAVIESTVTNPGSASAETAADLIDLRAAVMNLDPADRELLGLRFAVGMPSADVGAHLGISAEGARTRLHRLLQRLREDLRGE